MSSVNGSAQATRIDTHAAQQAAENLLRALGADLTNEGVRDTPRRMVAAYAEPLTPQPFNATTFPNDEGYDELIIVRAIPFHSPCMHHLLPFHGVAHIGYLPGERLIGLSKLGRVVEHFSRDLSSRSASPPRSPAGSTTNWRPRESAWSSRRSTCACPCAGSKSWGPPR
jgi:GTP cyclohydrolase I